MRFHLDNFKNESQKFHVMFSKNKFPRGGIVQFVTGIVAVLNDLDGEFIGIPIQLSKNWHAILDPNDLYASQYFHGYTIIEVSAFSSIDLELKVAYAHWGGVPTVSHAQLLLIGWDLIRFGIKALWVHGVNLFAMNLMVSRLIL